MPTNGDPVSSSIASDERWTSEALRLYERYQQEIVEGRALCPWAERARVNDRMGARVLLQETEEDLEPSLEAVADLAKDPRIEVGVLIYPRSGSERHRFETFVSRLREADAKRHVIGHIPFVMAAFHPCAEPDTSQPERLIPFLRRTPDPTIQLLRADVLEQVRERAPQGTHFVDVAFLENIGGGGPPAVPLRERIAIANLITAQRLGIPELTRHLDEICGDRERPT